MSTRGEARRRALVQAAASLLGAGGPAALSARAVAGEAGVPLAAVSYYFAGVDELVRHAAEQLYDGYLGQARALVEAYEAGAGAQGRQPGATGEWAEAVVRVWLDPTEAGPDPRRVRGTLTALAAAADSPALAPRLRRYDAELLELVQRLLRLHGRDTARTRVLLAALDGFALARLCGVDVSQQAGGPPDGPPDEAEAPSRGGGVPVLRAEDLLVGLVADLLLVADELAPVRGRAAHERAAGDGGDQEGADRDDSTQNSRAVGSSRPDSPT